MGTTETSDFHRLADRFAIQDAIYKWCRAVDRCDWNAIRTVFHPDAIDEHAGQFDGDPESLIAWLKGRHVHITSSTHLATNILIEFNSADSALVETYCTACQRYSPEGASALAAISKDAAASGNFVDTIMFGRYIDKFERRGGEWKIHRRVTLLDTPMVFEVPPGVAKMNPNWSIGRRDQSDVIFKLGREVALNS